MLEDSRVTISPVTIDTTLGPISITIARDFIPPASQFRGKPLLQQLNLFLAPGKPQVDAQQIYGPLYAYFSTGSRSGKPAVIEGIEAAYQNAQVSLVFQNLQAAQRFILTTATLIYQRNFELAAEKYDKITFPQGRELSYAYPTIVSCFEQIGVPRTDGRIRTGDPWAPSYMGGGWLDYDELPHQVTGGAIIEHLGAIILSANQSYKRLLDATATSILTISPQNIANLLLHPYFSLECWLQLWEDWPAEKLSNLAKIRFPKPFADANIFDLLLSIPAICRRSNHEQTSEDDWQSALVTIESNVRMPPAMKIHVVTAMQQAMVRYAQAMDREDSHDTSKTHSFYPVAQHFLARTRESQVYLLAGRWHAGCQQACMAAPVDTATLRFYQESLQAIETSCTGSLAATLQSKYTEAFSACAKSDGGGAADAPVEGLVDLIKTTASTLKTEDQRKILVEAVKGLGTQALIHKALPPPVIAAKPVEPQAEEDEAEAVIMAAYQAFLVASKGATASFSSYKDMIPAETTEPPAAVAIADKGLRINQPSGVRIGIN